MNLSQKDLAMLSQALSAHRQVLGAYLDVVLNNSLREALNAQRTEIADLHARVNLELVKLSKEAQ